LPSQEDDHELGWAIRARALSVAVIVEQVCCGSKRNHKVQSNLAQCRRRRSRMELRSALDLVSADGISLGGEGSRSGGDSNNR